MAWKKPPKPARRGSFSQAARCAIPMSSPPLIASAWPWSSPACGTSCTKLRCPDLQLRPRDRPKFLLNSVVGHFDDFRFAVRISNVTVRDVRVSIGVGKNGVLQLVHHGIVEAEDSSFRFREDQVLASLLPPRFDPHDKLTA